jgi:uncharacterized protein YjbI with pentapeptide repeats
VAPGPSEQGRPPKTLWDWLQLLIIPAGLAIVLLVLSNAQAERDRRRETRAAERDRASALDRARAETLRGYLQQMSDLTLNHHLLASREGASVQTIASTVTLATVNQLDGRRKGLVLQYLVGAGLVDADYPKVSLDAADLRGLIAPSGLTASNVDLDGADFRDADFSRAGTLGYSHDPKRPGYASFRRADLRGAVFRNPGGGLLVGNVIFSLADLRGADFSGVSFGRAVFETTCLSGARFVGAGLTGASFLHAQGIGVDFSHADLSRARFQNSARSKRRLARLMHLPLAHVMAVRNSRFADLKLDGAKLGGAALPPGWGPTGIKLTLQERDGFCRRPFY